MRLISIAALVAALGGCETARSIAPNTVAGFEAGGILGALDGASGAILARCQTLDGPLVRVTIDGAALLAGSTELVERLRAVREKACAAAALSLDGRHKAGAVE